MITKVTMQRELLEMIRESARRLHPRETILLLRGMVDKGVVSVSEVVIPPLATFGKGFSGFPQFMLPMDFSIIGTAHSHPSGNLKPSVEDLNHLFGKILLIVAFPYLREEDAEAYNREGKKLTLQAT